MNELDLSRQFRVYDNMLILFTQNIKAKSHCHHGIEIIIGLKDSFSIEHGNRMIKSKGAIIRQDIRHSISSGDGTTTYIFIEPEDNLGQALNRVLNGKDVLTLDKKVTARISEHLKKHLHTDHFEADMKQCLQDIFIPFARHDGESYLDERIKKVIKHINASLESPIDFTDLKTISCLSESRLIHLFKSEVGIPIRKYVLWCRLREALRHVENGNYISKAAIRSGFADAAHFSRTFVSMFGINPSQMLR